MIPNSPTDALGYPADTIRDLLVEIIRSRHDHAVEAHLASGSRYSMGFGSQWRDLLDDTLEAFVERGYQWIKLPPGGHKIPVVNGCVFLVSRFSAPGAVTGFASSATRKNVFSAQSPDPMLFEPGFGDESDRDGVFEGAEEASIGRLIYDVGDSMPVVLVMVYSSPRQLQSIEWAVAELDDMGKVKLHGCEPIWTPEANIEPVASDVESFDRGTPVEPVVEPREQEGIGSDAR